MSSRVSSDQLHETSGRSAPHHGEYRTDHDVEELVAAIQKTRTAGDSGDPADLWAMGDHLILPGFGPDGEGGNRRDDCGDDYPFFCAGCGDVKSFGRTCYSWVCSRCVQAGALRASKRTVAKLLAMRAYYDAIRDDQQRLHHIVVSPPDDWHPSTDGDSWKAAKTTVKRLLRAAGCPGWLAYHPLKGKSGDDRGAWKDRLLNGGRWADVAPELVFQPHFHAVVIANETPGGAVTKEIEERTGWVVHRITKEGSNVSIYGDYDLARAVTYCYSHTAVDTSGDRDSVCANYFGEYVNDAVASDRAEEQADAIVRAVAPKTLGVPYNSLACSRTRPVPVDDDGDDGEHPYLRVRVDRAAASAAYDPHAGAASDPWDDFAGGAGPDDVEDPGDVDEPDSEACAGRMLPIGDAARYLRSSRWVAQADHVDDLRETHGRWAERDHRVDDVDDVDQEDVDTVDWLLAHDDDTGPDGLDPPD